MTGSADICNAVHVQMALTPKGSKSGLMVKSWSWSIYCESVTKVSSGILKYAYESTTRCSC